MSTESTISDDSSAGTPETDVPTPLEAGGSNAIAMSYGLLADEWSLWIIRQALRGATHYTDWVHRGPIPGSALTSRLASLVEGGLLTRTQYSDKPVRHQYVLTTRGRQVWPILIAMWSWELRWVGDAGVDLPRMQHTECGQFFEPQFTCTACDGEATWADLTARAGPSGAWDRTMPTTGRRQRSRGDKRPDEVINETMELIGNRWSMSIIGAALQGMTRFSDIQRNLAASPTVVADRLRVFGELGVLTQVPSTERPDRHEYRLTAKGKAFLPVAVLMIEWGQRWFHAPEGPALVLTHVTCGSVLSSRLTCSECHEHLRGSTIETIQSGRAPSAERLL